MIQTNKKLKVVIDTNILLVSIPKKSKYNIIIQKLKKGHFDLFISNEILLEYKEIISKKTNSLIANNVCEALINYENVFFVNPYFNWNIITIDPDDNKFIDCAVAGNIDYIVTNDKHFDVLKTLDFPKINILTIEEFKNMI